MRSTPGPWQSDWEHGLIRAPDGSHVARMPGHSQGSSYGEANCNLIAAAPDLLEALKAYITFHDAQDGRPEIPMEAQYADKLRRDMRAAIAKAEGK